MTRPEPRDRFEAENPEPLRPDSQYDELGVWPVVLGVAIAVLIVAGSIGLIHLIGTLD
jgi:hypothetical protein